MARGPSPTRRLFDRTGLLAVAPHHSPAPANTTLRHRTHARTHCAPMRLSHLTAGLDIPVDLSPGAPAPGSSRGASAVANGCAPRGVPGVVIAGSPCTAPHVQPARAGPSGAKVSRWAVRSLA